MTDKRWGEDSVEYGVKKCGYVCVCGQKGEGLTPEIAYTNIVHLIDCGLAHMSYDEAYHTKKLRLTLTI